MVEYSGIINLALVTLFFSVILSPDLKRIGELKDEISSVDFPVIGTLNNDSYSKSLNTITEKGVELTKKLTQYQGKYNETRKFMVHFCIILGILAIVQLIVMYIQQTLFGVSGILFVGSLIVVGVVITLIKKGYMTHPSKVRSIQWLAERGILTAHTDLLFKPELILNGRVTNIVSNEDRVSIAIRSSADLNGYGYLLTVESSNYQKLYGVSVGFINNRQLKTTIAFPTGESGSESTLFCYRLNPGSYKVRLLFLSQMYSGNYNPNETIVDFKVPKKGVGQTQTKTIVIRRISSDYIFTVINKKNKQKIRHMEASEGFEGDNNIGFIFSSKKLLRYLSRGYRPIVLYSRNGDIDRYDLEKYLTFYRVWKRRIYKRFKNPFKSFLPTRGALVLLNRNPKSKLRTS